MTGEAFRSTFLNWEQIKEALPGLLSTGLLNTCVIAVLATILGSALALVLSVLGTSRIPGIRAAVRLYVNVFRGLPVILTVLLVGQGLPMAGVHILGRDGFPYAVLALGLVNCAYLSEIIRSGMRTVEQELVEAALTLGMTATQAINRIVLPLGIRRVLPALANQFIVIVKETSLVYLLGLATSQRDLFAVAQDQDTRTGGLSALMTAGALYLVITCSLTALVGKLDHRLRNDYRRGPITGLTRK